MSVHGSVNPEHECLCKEYVLCCVPVAGLGYVVVSLVLDSVRAGGSGVSCSEDDTGDYDCDDHRDVLSGYVLLHRNPRYQSRLIERRTLE